jgi:hypothetical protein
MRDVLTVFHERETVSVLPGFPDFSALLKRRQLLEEAL